MRTHKLSPGAKSLALSIVFVGLALASGQKWFWVLAVSFFIRMYMVADRVPEPIVSRGRRLMAQQVEVMVHFRRELACARTSGRLGSAPTIGDLLDSHDVLIARAMTAAFRGKSPFDWWSSLEEETRIELYFTTLGTLLETYGVNPQEVSFDLMAASARRFDARALRAGQTVKA